MAAIKSGASLVGVAFNQAHIDLLYARLESEVFREFQQPDSGLYEASLVSLLGPSKKRKPNHGEVMVFVFFYSRAKAIAKSLTCSVSGQSKSEEQGSIEEKAGQG